MPDARKILVVDGDAALTEALAVRLEGEGFRTQLAHNSVQASALLRNLRFDAVLIDVVLPDGDGERCYRDALPYLGSTPVIFTTAAGEVDQAIRLLKAGAADCVQKPYDIANLIERLRVSVAAEEPSVRPAPEPVMISPAMRDLGQRLMRLAETNFGVVVRGESGSGKEVVTRYLHRLSSRAGEPFVEIACANLTGVEGERLLFGEAMQPADHSARQVKAGALEDVRRGTLFLNDVEEMAAAIQGRLAQVIHERRFRRVGDVAMLTFDGRIVAATEMSSARLRERLRPTLFHRLAVVEIEVPPLRRRQEDLPQLVDSLVREVAAELGVPLRPIGPEVMAALRAHDWPGNVHELRNRLLRAMSFASSGRIGVEDLFPDIKLEEPASAPSTTLERARIDAERQRILDALAAHRGRIGHTARALGISRVTLWGKMKRLGISNGGVEYPAPVGRDQSDAPNRQE